MAKWLPIFLSCSLLSIPTVLGLELEMVVMVSYADVFNTSQVIPAVDLALEAVNNWSLPFSLSYDTILDSDVSTNSFITYICVQWLE